MKFWDQFKKKPVPPVNGEYHRSKSAYSKNTESSEAGESSGLRRDSDPDALARLYEDPAVKARMEEELGRSTDSQKESIQSLLGKGATTLGRSIKKVSNGQGVLDEEDHEPKATDSEEKK